MSTILDFLLPNSVLVPLTCSRDIQLSNLKKKLWKEAKKYPLYNTLKTPDKYIFVGVQQAGGQREFWDESKKLCDLKLFSSILKLVVAEGTKEEKNLDHDMKLAIGKHLSQLNSTKDKEIQCFRTNILSTISAAISSRESHGLESLARYHYPPDLELSVKLPDRAKDNLQNGLFEVKIHPKSSSFITLKVPWDIYPKGLIDETLPLMIRNGNCIKNNEKYVLNIRNTCEYLVAERPITQYKTIRACLSQGNCLELALLPLQDLNSTLKEFSLSQTPINSNRKKILCDSRVQNEIIGESRSRKSSICELCIAERVFGEHRIRTRSFCEQFGAKGLVSDQLEEKLAGLHSFGTQLGNTSVGTQSEKELFDPQQSRGLVEEPQSELSLWHASVQGDFKIHIVKACNIQTKRSNKFFVRVGLYHGLELLCPVLETESRNVSQRFANWLQFEIPIQQIPRAAQLCFSLCIKGEASERKRKRFKEDDRLFGWSNVNVFNFNSCLIKGQVSIPLQTPPEGFEDFLYPQGPVGFQGPSSGPHLIIECEQRFNNQSVKYPDDFKMREYGKYVSKLENNRSNYLKNCPSTPNNYRNLCPYSPLPSKCDKNVDRIYSICRNYASKFINDGDRDFLWSLRNLCPKVPDSLPRLVDVVNWGCRDSVSELYLLLDEWPLVSTETALELLQSSYPDPRVRCHAVESLAQSFPDEKLSQYLLQLVHTLKYETCLDSALLRFLLHKSLTNKHLGYLFFWHLRSEIHQWPSVNRCTAILEAFCKGLGPDLKAVVKHVELVNKLEILSDLIYKGKFESHKERTKYIQSILSEVEFSSSLENVSSPLRPNLALGRLKIKECKVLDSARKPLFITWENSNFLKKNVSASSTHGLIYKSGDDLRQDMLTLQVIEIMVQAWNNEGLDLKMTPYSCLATASKSGLIEVVPNAETVYNIQKRAKLGAMQVDSTQLFKWIKDKNCGSKLQYAIDTFTKSCAGYCVATFVLGIGDRHPDNIMVNSEGQIFHIDFGHFLGNFKKKFGIQRERVPFVLTQDFLKVITSGSDSPKDDTKFHKFQELCGKAYLALRKHSRLILSLFVLLISTGIPELESVEDLNFLKKTLAFDLSEKEALEYFQNQFCDAYGGAWTTKLDWFFHSVKHR